MHATLSDAQATFDNDAQILGHEQPEQASETTELVPMDADGIAVEPNLAPDAAAADLHDHVAMDMEAEQLLAHGDAVTERARAGERQAVRARVQWTLSPLHGCVATPGGAPYDADTLPFARVGMIWELVRAMWTGDGDVSQAFGESEMLLTLAMASMASQPESKRDKYAAIGVALADALGIQASSTPSPLLGSATA